MQVRVRIRADAGGQVQGRSPHRRRVEPHVQEQGHQFLGIQPEAHAQQVLGAALAVDFQVERFLLPQHFITHVFIGTLAENRVHGILHLGPGHPVARADLEFGPDIPGILLGHAGHFHAVDEDGRPAQVHGLRAGQFQGVLPQPAADRIQFFLLLLGGLVAPVDHGVDGRRIETHHPVAGEVRLDADIDIPDIAGEGILGEHVDAPPEDVGDVMDLRVAGFRVGQVDADDDVGSHLAGEVHREVVAHASVHEDHAFGAYRCEETRDGHGGTHGRIHAAAVPDLGLTGDDVGRDAGERDRVPEEVRRIGVPRRQAGNEVLDVLAEDETRREAAQQALGRHPAVVLLLRAEVEPAVRLVVVPDIFGELVPVILDAVIEREGEDELLLVFPSGIGDVLPVHLVAHGPVPVQVPHQRVQEFRRVADGIHSADETADGGSDDHVDRELVLFQVFERTHGRSALGTAAAEYQGYGGAFLPDLIHPGPHGRDRIGIGRVQAESGGGLVLRSGKKRDEKAQKEGDSFHSQSIRDCAGRPAGRRQRGCPPRGRRGSSP